MEFDFMLSNPPYGKSWKTDLERMGGKKENTDSRFTVQHQNEELSLITRSSDGQLMFLVNKLSKMNHNTKLGSRIAEVHNGSSLFTGDAGQGESNIRRWIIENDWCEAIIALPLNMFYNTDIATYIWVLTNRKSLERRNKIQLIDGTKISTSLRRNLGKKNCEFSDEQIKQILETFIDFKENNISKIMENERFGYWKITIERPLRLSLVTSRDRLDNFLQSCEQNNDMLFASILQLFIQKNRKDNFNDLNEFYNQIAVECERNSVSLTANRKKLIRNNLTLRNENAAPVIKTIHKGKFDDDQMKGHFKTVFQKRDVVVEFEADTALRDTEQIGLSEKGGIESFFRREVLPIAPDS